MMIEEVWQMTDNELKEKLIVAIANQNEEILRELEQGFC